MPYSVVHLDDVEPSGPGGVVRGSGYRVDGEEVAVREGTSLRFDPGTVRQPVAGAEGMTLVAIGARPGSYEPRGPF